MRRWRGAAYTYQHEASGETKRAEHGSAPTQNSRDQFSVFYDPIVNCRFVIIAETAVGYVSRKVSASSW